MIDYRHLALALTVLSLSACASLTSAPVVDRAGASQSAGSAKDFYTVKKGDTLYSIARDNGIDYRELVAMNSIENPGQIRVGQQLSKTVPMTYRVLEMRCKNPTTDCVKCKRSWYKHHASLAWQKSHRERFTILATCSTA